MELPRAGGRKREHLLLLHKCDRETNWKTMSFPAGSGGCGGEGHGYNRTISKRGLRQRNGGSRGDTLATARLAPEGAMRPPYLRCRCLLFDNEITLQVAGCSKKRWIFASLNWVAAFSASSAALSNRLSLEKGDREDNLVAASTRNFHPF